MQVTTVLLCDCKYCGGGLYASENGKGRKMIKPITTKTRFLNSTIEKKPIKRKCLCLKVGLQCICLLEHFATLIALHRPSQRYAFMDTNGVQIIKKIMV